MIKAIASSLAALTLVVFAVGYQNAEAQTKYGAAGCGLGSMLIGPKPGLMQLLAGTTNGSFGSQTFGITFGTSNCADEPGGAAGAVAFVETNREVLAKDIARGSGETLATLATISGCTDQAAVATELQANYGTIFPSSTVSDRNVGENVLKVLRGNATLSCANI